MSPKVVLFFFLLCLQMLFAEVSDIKTKLKYMVVVNQETPLHSVSEKDLALIFLGKVTFWEDQWKIQPCMLKESNPTMEFFLRQVLLKSVGQYRSYWRSKLYSGGGVLPKTFSKENQLFNYLSQNTGAIGVVPDQKIPAGLKKVDVSEGPK